MKEANYKLLTKFDGVEWFHGTLAMARDCFFSNCDSFEDLAAFAEMNDSIAVRVQDRHHLWIVGGD